MASFKDEREKADRQLAAAMEAALQVDPTGGMIFRRAVSVVFPEKPATGKLTKEAKSVSAKEQDDWNQQMDHWVDVASSPASKLNLSGGSKQQSGGKSDTKSRKNLTLQFQDIQDEVRTSPRKKAKKDKKRA